MKFFLAVGQLLISLALITLVLIQGKGTGLGKNISLGGNYHTKRGLEKIISLATITSAILFLTFSLINAFLV